MHEAINSVEFVLSKEHTLVNIQSMQDNMIELLIYFYYNPQTGMLRKRAIGQVQEAIFLACKREGIIIPYPHHVLTIDPQESELATMMIGVARHHHHAT